MKVLKIIIGDLKGIRNKKPTDLHNISIKNSVKSHYSVYVIIPESNCSIFFLWQVNDKNYFFKSI